jgi:hypothetical protein
MKLRLKCRATRDARNSLAALALGVALLAASGAAAAAQDGPSAGVGGSVTAQPIVSVTGLGGSSPGLYAGSDSSLSLELSARGPASAALRVRSGASLDASILSGRAASAAWSLASLGLEPADELFVPAPKTANEPAPESLVALRLRTLWLSLDPGWASLTLGRQVLSYGRGMRWSPVDIFSSLETTALATSRRGIDALRLKVPFGSTGLAEVAAAPASDPLAGRYLLRASGLIAPGLDLGLVGAWDGSKEDWQAGGDFKLDMGPGVYGEALLVEPRDGGAGRLRASVGADWSAGDFILAAEYYYNGGVAASADPYGADEHNLSASLTWECGQFVTLTASGLMSSGGGATATALATIDVAQDTKLSLYAEGIFPSSADPSAEAGLQLRYSF